MNQDKAPLHPKLLKVLRTMSNTAELIYNTAQMRYYQTAFLNEKKDPTLKSQHLVKAKQYEALVDNQLETLWPSENTTRKPYRS